VGQEGAVRVFWLQAEQLQGLVDRLALVLSEHMTSGDELHVTTTRCKPAGSSTPPQSQPPARRPRAVDRTSL
jgi:hypothetical protein